MEIKFFNERGKIKQKGIKEITESVFQEWRKECSRDSAKLRFKWSFDQNGSLIQVDDYNHIRGQLYKTIKYKRNDQGRYYEKSYFFYDSTGKIKVTDIWNFEFDDKGRPIIERLKRDTVLLLTNILTYDKNGNYIKQVRDTYWEWYFKYNKKGKLIESKECRREKDSTLCYNLTTYKYKNDLLIAEMKHEPRTNAVWNTISYTYDNKNNLLEILDPIKFTRKSIGQPSEQVPEYIRFTYDQKNNCISKSLSRKNEKPFRCYFYDYKYF